MSCTIKATRDLIYHCAVDTMEIGLKARMDEGKGVQTHINDE